jgi:hypothetical protein
MKKSTKADMGIRRRLYKLLRNGPQRCDRAAEGFEYGIVGVSEGITSTGIVPVRRHEGSGIGCLKVECAGAGLRLQKDWRIAASTMVPWIFGFSARARRRGGGRHGRSKITSLTPLRPRLTRSRNKPTQNGSRHGGCPSCLTDASR